MCCQKRTDSQFNSIAKTRKQNNTCSERRTRGGQKAAEACWKIERYVFDSNMKLLAVHLMLYRLALRNVLGYPNNHLFLAPATID